MQLINIVQRKKKKEQIRLGAKRAYGFISSGDSDEDSTIKTNTLQYFNLCERQSMGEIRRE